MHTPIVKEISALSAHRREVELVRWSLLTVPERDGRSTGRDTRDPLRAMDTASALGAPTQPTEAW